MCELQAEVSTQRMAYQESWLFQFKAGNPVFHLLVDRLGMIVARILGLAAVTMTGQI